MGIIRETATRASVIEGAIVSTDDLKPVLSSRYLVKRWLDRGATSVVYGESNAGKSFFAIDLAMHVAAGVSWHGRKVLDQKRCLFPVLYVAGEGGFGLTNRIEAMRRAKPELVQAAEKAGNFWTLPMQLDLCAAGDAEALCRAISSYWGDQMGLLVVDTLARAMGTGDENTAKDMGQFVRNIDLIRTYNQAHIMVIHHSGKDAAKGARGSSALRAAVDTEIELTRSGNVIQAETKKQRDMPAGEVFAFTLRDVVIGQDEDGDDVTSAVVEPTEPVAKRPKLTGQQKVAMQALDDAIAHHGEKKGGDVFPSYRRCVHLDRWRTYCDRHSLTSGEGDSAKRTAFMRVKSSLQEKGVVRIIDNHVWKCTEDETSQPSQGVTCDDPCGPILASQTSHTPIGV